MTVPNTENLSIGREKQTNSDVEFMIEPKPALMVGKGRIPQDMLDDLNSMCDDLQSNPETESYAPNLVGEIQNGSQLAVDIEDKRFKLSLRLSVCVCIPASEKFLFSSSRLPSTIKIFKSLI